MVIPHIVYYEFIHKSTDNTDQSLQLTVVPLGILTNQIEHPCQNGSLEKFAIVLQKQVDKNVIVIENLTKKVDIMNVFFGDRQLFDYIEHFQKVHS